jgi:hypothetical protein
MRLQRWQNSFVTAVMCPTVPGAAANAELLGGASRGAVAL